MRPTVALALILGAAGAAAILAGRLAWVGLVLVVCALLLLDVQAVLLRARSPAILPAAAVMGLGAPLAVALAGGAASVAAVTAAGFLAAIMLTLAGRRQRAAASLGATLLAGLVPGLGGSAVIALWDEDPAALLALVGIIAAGEAVIAAARRWGSGSREAEAGAALVAVAVTVAVATLALPLEVAAGLGALALLGVLGASAVRGALLLPRRPVPGVVLGVTASLALAAPAALMVLGRLPASG